MSDDKPCTYCNNTGICGWDEFPQFCAECEHGRTAGKGHHAARFSRGKSLITNAWQPIETVPKDGTYIMLYGTQEPHEMISLQGRHVFSGYWDRIDQYFCSTGSTWAGPFYECTHWMPLPPPPAD